MNIATLGFDNHILSFAEQIAQSPSDELTACFEAGTGQTSLAAVAPRATFADAWEILLDGSVADVVIVAARPAASADRELRDEQLKKLVQAGLDLILVQPACEMLTAFELQMIRTESRSLLLPFHPGSFHPLTNRVRQWLQGHPACPIGNVSQIQFDRFFDGTDSREILNHFTQDACLLRYLLGDVLEVSAMGTGTTSNSLTNLGVMLTGPQNRLARWNLSPAQGNPRGQISVPGSEGTLILSLTDEGRSIQLSNRALGEDLRTDEADGSPSAAALEHLRTMRQQRDSAAAEQLWEDGCRGLELEEAVERSVRRGRTIEMHHEQVTEKDTFKSMMAAGGCGLMMWVLCLLLLAGVVEGLQLPLRDMAIWRFFPIVLFAPLGLFLLLQLLQFVYPSEKPPASEVSRVDTDS